MGGGLQESGIQQSCHGVRGTDLSAQAQTGAYYNKIISQGRRHDHVQAVPPLFSFYTRETWGSGTCPGSIHLIKSDKGT